MVRLSLGIGTLCMWIVPHVGIELAGFRIMIVESVFWASRQEEARRVLVRTSAVAISFWVIAYTVTAIGVALSTQDMDSRADAIVIGTGNLIAAFALTMMSFCTAKWLGVFRPDLFQRRGERSILPDDEDCITVRHLRFDILWGIGRIFGQIYLLIMLQFCAIQPETVPVSAIIGIVAGLLLYSGVYLGRTRFREHKTRVALALSAGLSVAASAAFAYGCYYIQTVWEQDTGISSQAVLASMFFAWLFVCGILSWLAWWYTKKIDQQQLGGGTATEESNLYRTQMFAHKPEKLLSSQEPEEKPASDGEQDAEKLESGSEQNGGAREEGDEAQLTPNGDVGSAVDDVDEAVVVDEDEECATETCDDPDAAGKDAKSEVKASEAKSTEADMMRLIEERDENETTCKLLKDKCRCCCCSKEKKNEGSRGLTCFERTISFFKWLIAFCLNAFCLYFTIVNIGATSEMELVNAHLPNATKNLYPPDYQNGTMCAWDEATPDGEIKTFDTLQDVYDANWTVIHCEACANCSNWNDMEIQWETRDSLASQAQKCAMKSLFGSVQDVHQCYMDEVGFYSPCASCWTYDSMCSKYYCTFIFLQAVIINNAGNFSVGPNHVTSANCEEAMCGEEYAPCAGATRRRMNIESDIDRPEWQQCSVAEHDWAAVFGIP